MKMAASMLIPLATSCFATSSNSSSVFFQRRLEKSFLVLSQLSICPERKLNSYAVHGKLRLVESSFFFKLARWISEWFQPLKKTNKKDCHSWPKFTAATIVKLNTLKDKVVKSCDQWHCSAARKSREIYQCRKEVSRTNDLSFFLFPINFHFHFFFFFFRNVMILIF